MKRTNTVGLGLRHGYALVLLCVLIKVCPGYAQADPAIHELEQLPAELKLRTDHIPTSELGIRDEINWVNDQLELVRSLQRSQLDLNDTKKVLEDLRNIKARIGAAVEAFKSAPEKALDVRNTLVQFRRELQRPFFDLDIGNTKEYGDWNNLMMNNEVLFRGSTPVTASERRSMLAAIETNQVVQVCGALLDLMEAELRAAVKEEVDLQSAAKTAAAGLNDYKNALIKASDTKLSLQENLYLMILIIGGLSILAIITIRAFPPVVMLEWVVSGQVIQFVTVMVLLSAIMALGLSDQITENTLGTLLGGIAGYVLSQGVGKVIPRTTGASLSGNVTDGSNGGVKKP